MKIITGVRTGPRRTLLAGLPGVGKTTFGSQAPKPIFLSAEDGAGDMGADRAAINSMQDLRDAVSYLLKGGHEYRTVVLDSVTAMEAIIHAQVCAGAGVKSIGDIDYGRGYAQGLVIWQGILQGLDKLIHAGIHVVLIGHVTAKSVALPGMDPYDAYLLAMHQKSGDCIIQWADDVLFAALDMRVTEVDGRARAIGGQKRVLHSRSAPTHPWVKSRLATMPDSMDLSWAAYAAHFAKPGQNAVKTVTDTASELVDFPPKEDSENE